MQRPVIVDVLDVLQEVRKIHSGPGAGWSASRLRQEAVEAVASRELGQRRFSNKDSARKSIHDACSRRLNLKIVEFDSAVDRLLSGDPGRMETILQHVRKDVAHHAALAKLLASPSRQAVDIQDAAEPERRKTLINRIIRDTEAARALKKRYQDRCQICNVALDMGNGRTYSEAHHVRPLGQPHNGPDTVDNILVLCPNHHAQFDFHAIKLNLTSLHRLADHIIDEKHIAHHNNLYAAV